MTRDLVGQRTLLIATLFVANVMTGCGGEMKFVATPPARTLGEAQFAVRDVDRDNDSLTVSLVVRNGGAIPLVVKHSGIQLRLQDARLLANDDSPEDKTVVEPGKMKHIDVSFEQKRQMKALNEATLIFGGVTSAIDPLPKVIGEITISLGSSKPN